jgi:hypothetical protein
MSVAHEQIDRIAETNNFPSGQPAPTQPRPPTGRRYKTGRNPHVPLAELLDQAMYALEKIAQTPSV